MRNTYSIFTAIVFMIMSLASMAQTMDFMDFTKLRMTYRISTAIFFQGKYLVDDVFPKGECKLVQGVKGALTLARVSLSKNGAKPIKNIAFNVAIKNERTNTIWIFTKEDVFEIQFEDIMEKCEMGDRIIIMPADQQYALPQHEISLKVGC